MVRFYVMLTKVLGAQLISKKRQKQAAKKMAQSLAKPTLKGRATALKSGLMKLGKSLLKTGLKGAQCEWPSVTHCSRCDWQYTDPTDFASIWTHINRYAC
jgi:hypothetical protein